MGKGKFKFKEKVIVPLEEQMDDETFMLHLENRHAKECQIENYLSRHSVPAWLGLYRAFHERLHRIAVPGQHDHVHELDTEDD
jgi:hypothetical protein